jgi:hypothetical protein
MRTKEDIKSKLAKSTVILGKEIYKNFKKINKIG